MHPFRYRAIVEADHVIQNPLSPAKLRRLIDDLALCDGDRVIDVGCGKGWLLAEIIRGRQIEAIGLDLIPAFAAVARQAVAEAQPDGPSQVIEGPALNFDLQDGTFDAALCIGATFALGGLDGTLDWLARAVKPGGRVAVGEPYALKPFPRDVGERWAEYDRPAADIVERMAARGLALTGLIVSSDDDWDQYEAMQWRAATRWLRTHPDDPDAAWLSAKIAGDRARYIAEERACFGWAVFVADKV
jgi:SAM-dependent methyltransferase